MWHLQRHTIGWLSLAIILSGCAADGEGTSTESWSVAPSHRAASGDYRQTHNRQESLLSDTTPLPTKAYFGDGRLIGRPVAPSQSNSGSDDKITLNVVDLPVAQASKAILGDIMGANYSIDPKVEGKITVQTSEPTSRQQILALFEGALKSNGAILVESGGGYRIIPQDQASGAGALRIGRNLSRRGAGVQIVPLRYVAASEMKRILEPMAPKGGILKAEDSRNAIVLSGTSQELSAMIEAISVFDVDVMRGMSFAIVPVRSTQPDMIAEDLRTVFSSGKEGSLNGMVQFIPNKRLGAILVISSAPDYLTRAESWIRRLDAQAQGSEKQLFTYKVQNRPAKELVAIIQDMFTKEINTSLPTRSVAPRFQAMSVPSSDPSQSPSPFGAIIQPTAFGIGGNLAPSTPPPSQSNLPTSADTSDHRLGEEGRLKIAADEPNNALLIMATPEDYHHLERVIEDLDVVPNQVLIEATIAEVSLNDDLQFGLQWYFQQNHSVSSFTNVAMGAAATAFPGFSYALTAANTQVTLQALNTITTVNVLSSPSLMVLDNKTATLQVGDQVPISTQSAISTLTAGATVNSITYKDTGVILSVTPRVNENGRVLLDIDQEVSSVAPTTTSGIDSPTIQQRHVRTTVIVNDAQSVTLGGLIQNKRTRNNTQVPIVGDLPLIGSAFKQKDDTISKTELIIMITPHVIRDQNQARQITDEYRKMLERYAPHEDPERHLLDTTKRSLD